MVEENAVKEKDNINRKEGEDGPKRDKGKGKEIRNRT
jgi:hypothetical protein